LVELATHLRHLYLEFSFYYPGYHQVDKDRILFEDYLCYIFSICQPITIQEATDRILHRDIPADRCLVAFTFDDGFEECYTTIAPLLEKYGCNAAFFISSNYIESDGKYQKEFHNRINTYTKKPMSWQQVKDLHQRGHIIGAHTLDHVNMAKLSDDEMTTN
jgi:peptidoglycan/xylan/chitin deacetylase (PgdA/CDA1 family)